MEYIQVGYKVAIRCLHGKGINKVAFVIPSFFLMECEITFLREMNLRVSRVLDAGYILLRIRLLLFARRCDEDEGCGFCHIFYAMLYGNSGCIRVLSS